MAMKLTPFTRETGGNGHRPNAAADWPFPFPAPGKRRREPDDAVPPATAHRWPYRPLDPVQTAARAVPAPIPLADFAREVASWTDDVGVISIDHPALAHER